MNKHFFYSLLLIFTLVVSCRSINLERCYFIYGNECPQTKPIKNSSQKGPWITIWVHGTRAFFSRYFFQNFFYCIPGLNAAEKFDKRYHLRSIAELLSTQAPELFSFDTFYFFGWPGKLKHKARLKAAQDLFNAIHVVIKNYENTYNEKPRIRIITHSHGGNVALNMAHIQQGCNQLIVDELILLACPIQEQTVHYAHDILFKRIYALYSRSDSIQVMDPQGFHYWRRKHKMLKPPTFFSGRCFPKECAKVQQVAVQLNGKNLMHIDFLFHKFLKFLPDIVYRLREWRKKEIDQKPTVISITTKTTSR